MHSHNFIINLNVCFGRDLSMDTDLTLLKFPTRNQILNITKN